MTFDPEATYRDYRAEQQAQVAAAKAAAPQNCPYCGTPINRNSWNTTTQKHCGAPACRQKEYRHNLRNKVETARAATQARVSTYQARLKPEQWTVLQQTCNVLMADDAHKQVEDLLNLLDDQRCKHQKISTLTSYAELLLRRAQRAEEQAKKQAALDRQRIEELEQEILLYQHIERHIHGLGEQQLAIQPDQEPGHSPEPLKEAANIQ
jgi:hypothetical protein